MPRSSSVSPRAKASKVTAQTLARPYRSDKSSQKPVEKAERMPVIKVRPSI